MRARLFALQALVPMLVAGPALAQSPLDATRWGVVYDVPETRKVRLEADVPYLVDARDTLTLDIYRPAGAAKGTRPAVVFLNAIGDMPGQRGLKRWGIYRSWPRLVAAHGMVGISMDADRERIQESLAAVFRFLERDGARHGIDASRLGVYAASSNVRQSATYLMGPHAARGIRAAVLYYGHAPQDSLRRDLPVLFVFAEADTTGQRESLAGLWTRVIRTGAPWTLSFATDLPHAFDAFSDRDDARRLIRQTLDFWRTHLEPMRAVASASEGPPEARSVMAAVFAHDPARADSLLSRWIERRPDDALAYSMRGAVLVQMRRHAEAGAAYERALALGKDDAEVLAGLGQVRIGQQRWAEAADLLAQAVEKGALDSRILGNLAWAQLQLGRNEEAVRSYEQAFEIGIPPGRLTRGVASYNLACGYARIGKADKALDALAVAAQEGFGDRASYEADPDLAPLRGQLRYREIVGRLPAGPTN